MVHREGIGENAAAADPAVGRLQPGDAAHRGRTAHRAAGIGADSARHKPGRDRGAGAARRTARQPLAVPWIERRRPRQVPARPAEREFPRRQLAEHDAARRLQTHDDVGVLRRHVILAQLRVPGGADAGGLDDVL